MTTELRPTPECDAAIDDSPYYQSRFVMVAADFARKLERERDEARERERVAVASWNEERLRGQREAERVVALQQQLEALRKTLIESEAYQAGLVADIEVLREAIKEARIEIQYAEAGFAGLALRVCPNDSAVESVLNRMTEALAKLQPFIKP